MADKYQPPKGAASNARKVIEWKEQHGDEVKGMTQTGWVRARQLASGKPVSADIVKRMASFARHRKNAAVDPKFKDTPWKDRGHVSWLGWGGDTGINWAIKTSEGMKNESEIENMAEEKNIIKIYGTIGREVWAEDVEYQLNNMEGDVTVKINSVGGSVLEAIDIFNALKAYKGNVTTVNMGKALSAGSYIFLAGDRRVVMSNSLTMIHAARMDMAGATETQMDEAKKMLGAATLAIAKEYSKALGTDLTMAKTLLDSGDVWYDSSEALESGLATEVIEPENQASSALLMAEFQTAGFELPEKYLSKLEITMTDLISKLEAFTNDAALILNCVKDGLTYEQSLEAIIKNMEEKKEEPKSEDDEYSPEMTEEEKVEAAEEVEEAVEAEEEKDEMSAQEKMEEFLKSNLDEEKYAEYEEMVKGMEEEEMPEAEEGEDKPEAEDEEDKPEAEGDEEKPEAEGDEDKMEDEESEEDKLKAILKTGVKPVAVSTSKATPSSARQQWKQGVEDHMAKTGCDRVKAIIHMNVTNPELRLLMIEEANK